MSHNVYAIPQELRAIKAWVLWKYEDIGAKKPTKIPYQHNGQKADITNADHWSDFQTIFNVHELGGYDGIGFVFDNSHPYSFIDLDDPDGAPDPQLVINR